MKSFILLLLICNYPLFAKNLGHRAGGGKNEYFRDLPENSLSALEASLTGLNGEEPIQFREDFDYLEFDVQETYDKKVVVFHDKTLRRMVPFTGENKNILESIYHSKEFKKRFLIRPFLFNLGIKHLTLAEIKQLRLKNSEEEIPTLDEFVDGAQKWNLEKPFIVEVKYFYSDTARKSLIESVARFKSEYMDYITVRKTKKFDFPESVAIMGWSNKILDSFDFFQGKLKRWCNEIKKVGLKGIFRPKTHQFNHCKI